MNLYVKLKYNGQKKLFDTSNISSRCWERTVDVVKVPVIMIIKFCLCSTKSAIDPIKEFCNKSIE